MSRRGLFLFASMCLLWGIPYFFIRVAVLEISPATLVFFRTLIAALVLLPIAFQRGSLPALRPVLLPLLVFALVEIAIPWLAISSAEQQISSSLAGLLISATPLVTTLIALAFRTRERSGPAALAGLAVGLLGVAAVVGLDLHATGWLPLFEMGLVVVGYSLGPILLSRYLDRVPAEAVMAVALGVCAVGYAPIAAFSWPHSVPHLGVIAAVLVLALVCTALAFLVFAALIAEVGPVRSTVITYVNPAVAAVLGVAVLHESFTVGMGAGFVLILVGSVLATRRPRPAPAIA